MNLKIYFITIFLIALNIENINGARDPPTVTIPHQGTLMGMVMKMFRIQRIIAYLGIPYAQPPIAEKRFTPPVVDDLPAWDGIRNATELPKHCWSDTRKQPKQHEEAFARLIGIPKKKNYALYDEDCLFLNIYIPDDPPPADGYAVIVWLHSGDFSSGNASELSPFQLVLKQKLIVITVAYRLGIFGFFTSMDGSAPGNFGLMDQAAALLWINRNIMLFGGNKEAVTLMGHGSGAISTSLHLTSGDWSAGLFKRAIIMSGSSLSVTAIRDPKSYSASLDQVALTFGCYRRPTVDLLNCLRRVEASILMDGNPVLDWGPVVDGNLSNTTTPFVPDDPRILIERNDLIGKVSILIGFTDTEDSLDVSMGEMMEEGVSSEMYETIVNDVILNELSQLNSNETCGESNNQLVLDAINFVYKPYPPVTDPMVLRKKFIDFNTERYFASPTVLQANYFSKVADTYVYRFDIKAKTVAANEGLPTWVGVPHRYDLIFVWGFPYWVQLENQTQWDSADKRVSDIIMTLWANFAKFGQPTKIGVYINWDPFTTQDQGVLIIDRTFNMSDFQTLNYQAMQFWNDYYPKVINFATQCCNATDNSVSIIHLRPSTTKFIISTVLLQIIIFCFYLPTT